MQEAVAVTTAIQEGIFLEMGVGESFFIWQQIGRLAQSFSIQTKYFDIDVSKNYNAGSPDSGRVLIWTYLIPEIIYYVGYR